MISNLIIPINTILYPSWESSVNLNLVSVFGYTVKETVLKNQLGAQELCPAVLAEAKTEFLRVVPHVRSLTSQQPLQTHFMSKSR